MTPDELLALADNPDFIAGIYNYCDRWCERCSMTHGCLLFASTPVEVDSPEVTEEERQAAFLKQIENSFALTIDLIYKLAAEKGIDLQETTTSENSMNEFENLRKKVKKSPLSLLAHQYSDCARKWLDHSGSIFKLKDKELERVVAMQLPDRDPAQEAAEMKNGLDIIYWYCFQIQVKLVRAQTSSIRQSDWEDEDEEPYPKDSDGSAKIALIGIDRSIGAWGILLKHLPDHEESILNILTILERLRRMTEQLFPAARNFVRPGFDE